jgi:hypothetical protein
MYPYHECDSFYHSQSLNFTFSIESINRSCLLLKSAYSFLNAIFWWLPILVLMTILYNNLQSLMYIFCTFDSVIYLSGYRIGCNDWNYLFQNYSLLFVMHSSRGYYSYHRSMVLFDKLQIIVQKIVLMHYL